MTLSGNWCQDQDIEGLRRSCNLLTMCWKAIFWTNLYVACWWTLGHQTLLSNASCFFLWKDLCIPLSPADLEQSGNCTKLIAQIKPLAGHNSSNPLNFNWLYHIIYSHTKIWYIFKIFIWVIDRSLIKLRVSFMFKCYKQTKEKMCCLPRSYSSWSWDCFYKGI